MLASLIRRFSSMDQNESPTYSNETEITNGTLTRPAISIMRPVSPTHMLNTPSDDFHSLLDPVALLGHRDDISSSTQLLNSVIAEEIRLMIPERMRISEKWKLIYSLSRDGASLATLYKNCRQFQDTMGAYILVVKDMEGGIFGGYMSEYPHPAPTFYGNGECFLWRASLSATQELQDYNSEIPATGSCDMLSQITLSTSNNAISKFTKDALVRFKAFPYSGENDYFMNCETKFLSMGAGDSHYGLWLDDSLERGHSSTSQTFGNEPLSDVGDKFDILGVELWGIQIV